MGWKFNIRRQRSNICAIAGEEGKKVINIYTKGDIIYKKREKITIKQKVN